jgi:ParB-like chromosome segregation protein Spo0J
MDIRTIELDSILPAPLFLRTHGEDEDHIKELATDLAENGMDTPIVVIDNGDNTFTLNDGSRRYTAAMFLDNNGQSIHGVDPTYVPVRVIGNIADWSEADQLANQMRLNSHVLTTSPKQYFEACLKLAATGMNAKQIGAKINKAPAVVGSWLKSLNVPEEWKTPVMEGEITLANAKVIADNKRHLDSDILAGLIDEAKTSTVEDFTKQVTDLVNEAKEKASNSTDDTPKGFVLTPVLMKKDEIQEQYEKAVAEAEEVPTDFNTGFLSALQTIYQIDPKSASRRQAEYDKAEQDKETKRKAASEAKLIKSLGVKADEFIAEHGEDAFKELLVKARAEKGAKKED